MRFQAGNAALAVLLLFCANVSVANAQPPGHRGPGRVAPVFSDNFVVHARDPVLAKKVSVEAERFRKKLAIEWLGDELPKWEQRCPITVELGMHAGGETSFAFIPGPSGRGRPIDWKMKIYGPHDRVLDAVLPHEITHTIFATHFGQPLPRWADEGACTTVEHESERQKNHALLMDFLHATPSRGLPFNRMFTMRNYPHDILPLYAQGYSVAKFLILQKGKQYFLDYIGAGLRNEQRGHALSAWNSATSEFYEYDDLSDLQLAWLDWVRNGSSETAFRQNGGLNTAIANADAQRSMGSERVSGLFAEAPISPVVDDSQATYANGPGASWYAQQMQSGRSARVAAQRQGFSQTRTRKAASHGDAPSSPRSNGSKLPQVYQPDNRTIWR